jgi:hypothetical protein
MDVVLFPIFSNMHIERRCFQIKRERYRSVRCLRKVVNKTRQDKVKDMDIRNTIGIPPCIKYIKQQRLK